MLLKEDGHLDVERVRQLGEEEFRKEKRTWGNDQLIEWERSKGTMTHEEVFGYLYKKIEEFFAGKDKQIKKQKMIDKIVRENEIIINGSRVFIENGEVKKIFNEEIRRKGYMSVEECAEIVSASMKLLYKIMEAKQRKQYPILTPEGKEKWLEATSAQDEVAERMRLQALTNSIFAAEGSVITLSFKEYSPVGKQKFFVDLSFESVYRADADKVIFYGDMVVLHHSLGKGFIVYSLADKSFHKGHLASGTNVEPNMRLAPDDYREENLGLIDRLGQHILEYLCLEAGYEVNTNN